LQKEILTCSRRNQKMKQLYFSKPEEWREWLKQNHDQEKEVWLIFFKKKTGKLSLKYESAVEEALCFGWIDSIVKKIDEEKYAQKFTPRKDKSKWSDLNKKRVDKLIKNKQMTEAGLCKIEAAKKNGMWYKPDRPNIQFVMPVKFKSALEQNSEAKKFFDLLSPTYQKQYIGWIVTAKMDKTKQMRIRESIRLLEKGEKLGLK